MNLDLSKDEIQREVQKRKDEAKSLGLPAIIEFAFESIKHYPSWKEKFPQYCLAEIEHPRKASIDQEESIVFLFDGHEYSLGKDERHTTFPDGDGYTTRDYYLYNGDRKLIFRISGSVENDGYVSTFKYHDVTAYIPGDWTDNFVKLHYLRKEHKDRQSAEREAELASKKLMKLKNDFGL
jgi:hypothetical protein